MPGRLTPRFNPSVWYALGSGPMILGAAFFTIAVSEVQTENPHPALVDNVWCLLGILLLVVGAVAFIIGGVGAFFRWQDENETPFELSLDGDECLQLRPSFNDQQVRVRVRNKSSYGVTDVRVKIRDRDPSGYSHYLAQMHDAGGVVSLGGDDLGPGDYLFCDVADTNFDSFAFAFSFATPHLRRLEMSTHPVHTFAIEVRGRHEETRRSVKACSRRFQLRYTQGATEPLDLTTV